MTVTIQLALAIASGLIVAGFCWWLHHAGYVSGQNERTAYYAPLMEASEKALADADRQTLALERAALTISDTIEAKHAAHEKDLTDRIAAAQQRIADVLRQHASDPAASCSAVPAVPGRAPVTAGTAAGGDRDARLAVRVSGVGGECEHDAAEVAGWQDWNARQRALNGKPPSQ